ncbi:ankyrin repeat domain-containing protein [Streptomyces cyaneofuscatus]|uniref:ankyrin repeat domain-containing protein n=1 Tax=Streptomyces TaxID=1883 RepID=UPI0004C96E1C|nr:MULTISPECIES: ankyrin repeat domain-containing protein [Streptomyces]CAD5970212.1 Ankyrin repeats (3 copies) [Streptomyces sp. KY75]CAD5973882.1 Ankyrin repeats (3 copies) [Streptomyces sp. KY70]
MDVPDRLALAAGDGDVAAVARLLSDGVEVDGLGGDGRSALDLAVHAGHVDVVRVLLDAGADPRQRAGAYGEVTPLGLAAMYGYVAVAELLLDAGATTGAQGRLNFPPLVLAATSTEHGHPQMVDLLLRRGADIGEVKKGRTSLEWAAAFGNVRMVRHLLARGATPTAKALREAHAGAERYAKAVREEQKRQEKRETYALVFAALRAAGVAG